MGVSNLPYFGEFWQVFQLSYLFILTSTFLLFLVKPFVSFSCFLRPLNVPLFNFRCRYHLSKVLIGFLYIIHFSTSRSSCDNLLRMFERNLQPAVTHCLTPFYGSWLLMTNSFPPTQTLNSMRSCAHLWPSGKWSAWWAPACVMRAILLMAMT